MENAQKDTAKEVDLLEISGKISSAVGKGLSRFFTWLLQVLEKMVMFFVRKSLWFGACIIIMLGVSLTTYKSKRTQYSSLMVARMNVLDNAFAIGYVNGLNASVGDPQLVKETFSLPDTVLAKDIAAISGYWGMSYFGGGVDYVDYAWRHTRRLERPDSLRYVATRVDDRFYVKINMYDKDVQPYLTRGLIDNMCNNSFLQEANKVRKLDAKKKIDELNRQIRVLDSLQRYEYFVKDVRTSVKPLMTGQVMLVEEKDRVLYHNEIMKLHAERVALESNLELYPEPISVLQGFETNLQLETTFFGIAKRALAISLLITLLVALAWDNRKWLYKNAIDVS